MCDGVVAILIVQNEVYLPVLIHGWCRCKEEILGWNLKMLGGKKT